MVFGTILLILDSLGYRAWQRACYAHPICAFARSAIELLWSTLGSGLIGHNQKMTVAAIAMAEKKPPRMGRSVSGPGASPSNGRT